MARKMPRMVTVSANAILGPSSCISSSAARGSKTSAAHGKPLKNGVAVTVRRNAPCPCGSGKKYKHCHLTTDLGRMF